MEIVQELKEVMKSIGDRYGIRYALLFGSYARGDYKPYSDLDIAVKFDRRLDRKECFMKSGELSSIISEKVGKEVNVVPLNLADSILKYEVFSNGTLIYCKDIEEFRMEWINGIDEYLDFKGMFERHYKRIKKEIFRR